MIVVTGAGGHLGRALARGRALGDRGALPTIVLTHADADICDAAAIEAALAAHAPSVVINAAGYARVDAAEHAVARAFAVNRDGAERLARACAAHGAALIHVSSDQVFSGAGAPFREDHPVAPENAYAQSKAEGEAAVRAALERHVIVRTAWLLSPDGENFVSSLYTRPAELPLQLVAGRRANPTPVDALASRLLSLAARIANKDDVGWGSYHIAGEPAATLADVAEHLFAARRARGEAVPTYTIVDGSHRPGEAPRPGDSSLDTRHTRRVLGIDMPRWRDES